MSAKKLQRAHFPVRCLAAAEMATANLESVTSALPLQEAAASPIASAVASAAVPSAVASAAALVTVVPAVVLK